jgi:hypothetical protein
LVPTFTVIVPVEADGTITTKRVLDALVTVAATPLNFTVLLVFVDEKAVPNIVTDAPTGAFHGEKSINDNDVAAVRTIDSRFPAAS